MLSSPIKRVETDLLALHEVVSLLLSWKGCVGSDCREVWCSVHRMLGQYHNSHCHSSMWCINLAISLCLWVWQQSPVHLVVCWSFVPPLLDVSCTRRRLWDRKPQHMAKYGCSEVPGCPSSTQCQCANYGFLASKPLVSYAIVVGTYVQYIIHKRSIRVGSMRAFLFPSTLTQQFYTDSGLTQGT